MPQPPKLSAETRTQITTLLPDALEASLASYHKFVTTGIEEKATKEFSAHHTAAKVALAHIKLLIQLAGILDASEGKEDRTNDLMTLMNRAMVELGDFAEGELIEAGEENE